MSDMAAPIVPPSYARGFARSANESESPNLWRGLIAAYLPCLGPTNYTLADVSAYNRHATLIGCEPIQNAIVDDEGQFALSLDGTNDYAFLAPGNSFSVDGNAQITVSLWWKTHIGQAAKTIFQIPEVSGSSHSIIVQFVNAATIRYYVRSGGVANAVDVVFTYAGAGWLHSAWTYNGARVQAYLNGTLRNSVAQTGLIDAASNEINIGRYGTFGQYYQGLVDDIRIYDRALEPEEILQLSTRRGIGFEKKRAGLPSFFHFPVTYNIVGGKNGEVLCGGVSGLSLIITKTTSGGVRCGGVGSPSLIITKPTSGGVVCAGVGSPSLIITKPTSGGVVCAGQAGLSLSQTETPTGGAVCGGEAAVQYTANTNMSGGVVCNGQAMIVFNDVVEVGGGVRCGGETYVSVIHTASVSGGVVCAGEALNYRLFQNVATGGVVCAGEAFNYKLSPIVATGGAVCGGTATKSLVHVYSITITYRANLTGFPWFVRFPILINATQPSIVARDVSSNVLPVNVVTYSPTTGSLAAFIKTDLSASADTSISLTATVAI